MIHPVAKDISIAIGYLPELDGENYIAEDSTNTWVMGHREIKSALI